MSIVEIQGGPITHKYLMGKLKREIADEAMRLLRENERLLGEVAHLGAQITQLQANQKPPVPEADEFTNAELLTLSVSLGMMVLMQARQLLPEHSRNARKIKAVEDALLDLVRGSGAHVTEEMCEFWADAWNSTMRVMQDELAEARKGADHAMSKLQLLH